MKNDFFKSSNLPYLLTILFVALAWTVNQITQDITSSPSIEVRKHPFDINKSQIVYTVTNISSKKLFKELIFKVYLNNSNAEFTDEPSLKIFAPIDFGDSANRKKPEIVKKKYAKFIIINFQPRTTVELIMKTNKKVDTTFRVNSQEVVRVLNASFESLLIKHKFRILLCLIAFWVISIFVYVYMITPKDKPEGVIK